MASACFNPSCSQPGTLTCGRCMGAKYCGPNCQRSHWSAHKATCKAAAANQSNNNNSNASSPKANCYILRAASKTANNNISDHIEPFPLSNLGDEMAEKRQLERHCGWKGSIEVGKFYDHLGSDGWYYYVYGDARAFKGGAGLPPNEVARLVCHGKGVYGDVGIVRSGPVGSRYAEEFSATELAKAVEFYRTNDKDAVFAQREMSRMARIYGGGPGGRS